MTIRIQATIARLLNRRPTNLFLPLLAAAPMAVLAQATSTFDLPAQPLAESLKAVGTQTNTNVLVVPELVEGKQAPALRANLTVDQAMTELLKGTGITYRFLSEKTVILAAQSERNGKAGVLDFSPQGEWTRLAQAEGSSSGQGSASSPAGSQSAGSEEEMSKLEEIVVTAQKRKEGLQEVPISISVLSGEDLDRSAAEGITEELSRVPGVAVFEGVQGGGTVVKVRGVTAPFDIGGGASPIAYYVDSIPFGLIKSSILPDPSGYDLERVEVLKGPQGTLYGAGGQGGVVRVLSHDADLNQFELKARTSASSTKYGGGNYRGDMAINVPIIEDKLAVRAVVGYNHLSGWVDGTYPTSYPDASLAGTRSNKDINDAGLANFRFKLNAQPTENLSIGLSAWLSRQDYGAPNVSGDDRTTIAVNDSPTSIDFSAYGLTVGYEFTAFSVTSATGYIDYSDAIDQDIAAFGLEGCFCQVWDSKVFSEEILFSSRDEGPWEWSFGLFYRDVEDGDDRVFIPSLEPFVFTRPNTSTSKSYAVFGEISRWLLPDQLKLTLGLRNFHDRATTTQVAIPRPGNTTLPAVDEKDKYHATTPRAVLTWLPNKDLTLYASYAQGFKSGVQQYPAVYQQVPNAPSAEPDLLTNYEVGMKGDLLDGRLSFETAVYYMDWKDKLELFSIDYGAGVFGPGFTNGKSQSGFGVDLAMTTRPLEGLMLGATLSWNDLTYAEDVQDVAGNTVLFKGDRSGNSPRTTAGGFAEYAFPIGAGGFEGRLSGAVNYTSTQFVVTTTNVVEGDSILTSRAAFSIEAPNRWTATIFAENLNNEQGAVSGGNAPTLEPRIRPRTIGLQLEYRVR